MPAESIQIAIVEDDPQFLGEVVLLLEGSPSLEVVGQFTRGREGIEGIVEKRPQVALIDLGLPDLSGVEVIRALSEQGCGTELLALTIYDDDEHLFAALRAGAVGYIVKGEMSLWEVLKTVEDVIRGRASMSMGLARRILEAFREVPRKERKPELQGLTDREREVLQYLARGFYPKKIAELLGLKYETVRKHLRHIYEKLQVNSALEAVAVVKGLRDL